MFLPPSRLIAIQKKITNISILLIALSIEKIHPDASYKNKTIIYTYQFLDSNTRLFTLKGSFTGNKQVQMFVQKLNERISQLNIEENNIIAKKLEIENKNSNNSEDNYVQFTKHLDFLFNHGAINDAAYKRIENKINDIIYGVTNEKTLTNIIYFPGKAS